MERIWREVLQTVADEFSDIADVQHLTRIMLRLLVAALLGGLLGYEREAHGKAAGVRTHMLVAIGGALFVLVPQQAGASISDVTRVVQGLVAGIGFLGAGAIVKGGSSRDVRGLTTAAGVWMTAAIGVAAGLGREATALLSTLLALAVFELMPHVVRRLDPTGDKPVASADDDGDDNPSSTPVSAPRRRQRRGAGRMRRPDD